MRRIILVMICLLSLQCDRKSFDEADWLIKSGAYEAKLVETNDKEIALDNGLIRRVFRIKPEAATIAIDNLMTGQSVLRGVKPEARLVINGIEYNVGGLIGQPNLAYLDVNWVDDLTTDPNAFRSWILINVSYDKVRNTLAQRKMYRTIAPWTTENPLMMHIRYSKDEDVKLALDQCEAATIEPLNEHLEHYEMMMIGNLANGVQACYRGPRLYDTDETKKLVTKWVKFYKKYRDIMESDVIHSSSRRADGRGLDWIFHANPDLDIKGFTMIFNPTNKDIEDEILLNTYYTGITGRVQVEINETEKQLIRPDRNYNIMVPIKIKANGFAIISLKSI